MKNNKIWAIHFKLIIIHIRINILMSKAKEQ